MFSGERFFAFEERSEFIGVKNLDCGDECAVIVGDFCARKVGVDGEDDFDAFVKGGFVDVSATVAGHLVFDVAYRFCSSSGFAFFAVDNVLELEDFVFACPKEERNEFLPGHDPVFFEFGEADAAKVLKGGVQTVAAQFLHDFGVVHVRCKPCESHIKPGFFDAVSQ